MMRTATTIGNAPPIINGLRRPKRLVQRSLKWPTRGWTRSPESGPHVRDPELLHVRHEKRELQGPPELNATDSRRYPKQQPQRNPSLGRRSSRSMSSLGPAVLAGTLMLLGSVIRHCV